MENLLDRLLVTMEVRLEAFALLDVRSGYRLVFDALDAVIIHYVLSGSGLLEVPGEPPLSFSAGSIVILPAGMRQAIRIDGGAAIDVDAGEHCAMVKDGLIRFEATGGGTGELTLLCGSIMASTSGSYGLFDKLRRPVHDDLGGAALVRNAFAMLSEEVAAPDFGTRALAGSLMKMCLTLLVRRHLHHLSDEEGLAPAFADDRLRRAVLCVMEQPARPHTVASLASVATMSRSAFARAFERTFAMSPMGFVGKTRLHHAAELLVGTDLPIKAIAGSIGFASRSHFSRAFRAAYGRDPKSFRQRAAQLPVKAPSTLRGDRARFALSEEPEDIQSFS